MIDLTLPFVLTEFAQRIFELKAYRCLVYEYNLKELSPISLLAESELVYLSALILSLRSLIKNSKKVQQVFRWRLLTSTAQPKADGSRLIGVGAQGLFSLWMSSFKETSYIVFDLL